MTNNKIPQEIEDEIIKKLRRKYHDKNEGYESGYVEDYFREAIKQGFKTGQTQTKNEVLKLIENKIEYLKEEITLWENNLHRDGTRWNEEEVNARNDYYDKSCYARIEVLEELKAGVQSGKEGN